VAKGAAVTCRKAEKGTGERAAFGPRRHGRKDEREVKTWDEIWDLGVEYVVERAPLLAAG
jgi:hypothetical protein